MLAGTARRLHHKNSFVIFTVCYYTKSHQFEVCFTNTMINASIRDLLDAENGSRKPLCCPSRRSRISTARCEHLITVPMDQIHHKTGLPASTEFERPAQLSNGCT